MVVQRTAYQILVDAMAKHRVMQGIAVLEERYGPDWADMIDLDSFVLSSAHSCVLGQIYQDKAVTYEQMAAADADNWRNWGETVQEAADSINEAGDGYDRGLFVLDGDVIENPDDYGFLSARHHNWIPEMLKLSDSELAWHGVTREMVQNAIDDDKSDEHFIRVDYQHLTPVWVEEIASRQR